MNKPLILIVEDDAPVRNLISVTLEAHDYKYISAANAAGAILEGDKGCRFTWHGELSATVDEQRILLEAAVFADKVAVDEETVRLHSHLSQFRKMMEEGSPIGRKLDFLIQEFNREANTIGSKCQDSEIAYLVVDLKSEIEKIREQVQNIE